MDYIPAPLGDSQSPLRTDLPPVGESGDRPCVLKTSPTIVIGYISDQKPFWNNIHHWVDFLHHDTPVLTGTERIARRMNHAVFYLDVRRIRRGYYEAEIKLITREPQTMKEFELTDIYYQHLEQSILRAPEFWLWSHERFNRTREEFNIRYEEETGRVSLEPLEVIKKRKGII